MKFQQHEYYNCEIVLDNNERFKIGGNWLHNQGLDHWCGWSCEAGYTRLYINTDNDIYSGQCLNDYLGNLNTEWQLLQKPTTCFQQNCTGCTDDLIVAKKEAGNNER